MPNFAEVREAISEIKDERTRDYVLYVVIEYINELEKELKEVVLYDRIK